MSSLYKIGTRAKIKNISPGEISKRLGMPTKTVGPNLLSVVGCLLPINVLGTSGFLIKEARTGDTLVSLLVSEYKAPLRLPRQLVTLSRKNRIIDIRQMGDISTTLPILNVLVNNSSYADIIMRYLTGKKVKTNVVASNIVDIMHHIYANQVVLRNKTKSRKIKDTFVTTSVWDDGYRVGITFEQTISIPKKCPRCGYSWGNIVKVVDITHTEKRCPICGVTIKAKGHSIIIKSRSGQKIWWKRNIT